MIPIPLNLGNDTLFCFGTNVDIETNLYGATYLWSDSSIDSLATFFYCWNSMVRCDG